MIGFVLPDQMDSVISGASFGLPALSTAFRDDDPIFPKANINFVNWDLLSPHDRRKAAEDVQLLSVSLNVSSPSRGNRIPKQRCMP